MMFKTSFVLCCVLPVILGVPFSKLQNEFNEFPQDSLKVPDPAELAQQAGYVASRHEVVTEDRYILQLHRINGSSQNPPSANRPAVLLVHGLLDCGASWLLAGPEKGLGFILADRGYDVWLANVRGTRYSRRHLDWTISDNDYWKFSWHELGVYDLPAMIDYILNETGREKIFYISHSQGGTALLVMASERPEYQKKITAAFPLAPAVFMSRTTNILGRLLAPIADNINAVADLIGLYEFKPSGKLIQVLAKHICQEDALLQPICENIIFLVDGFGDKELNMTLLPVIAQYDPAGASTRQFVHFGQSINSGKFRQFNHGLFGNLRKYGKIHPPDYNLKNINMPVHLYYSDNDVMVDVPDLLQLYRALPNATKHWVPYESFTHLDYLWGKHAKPWVYERVISFMAHYRN